MSDSTTLTTLVENLWTHSEGGEHPTIEPLHGGSVEIVFVPRAYGCAMWAECGGRMIAQALLVKRERDLRSWVARHVREWLLIR